MKKTAIIVASEKGRDLGLDISKALGGIEIFSSKDREQCTLITSIPQFIKDNFDKYTEFIFIGAMGICVRAIASQITDKKSDAAVINVDSTGKFVVSVLSGHVGGANELTNKVASIIGGIPVISTQSDNMGLWALDILGRKYDWETEVSDASLNEIIYSYVNENKFALLLDVRDEGTDFMESTISPNVSVYYNFEDIDLEDVSGLIIVSPFIYRTNIPTIYYRPKVLNLGMGCRKNASSQEVALAIKEDLENKGFSPLSIKSIGTIELKKDELAIHATASMFDLELKIYTANELSGISVPNPSQKVYEVTSVFGVAETVAIKSSANPNLILEKQKVKPSEGNDFTYAIGLDVEKERRGFIDIVGAGPGDPELISLRGKKLLEKADLVLYAGSLVPIELTRYAPSKATVKSSADMNLDEQFALMKAFYDKKMNIVRLHTGDPCIYGAIQEQMALFDKYNMDYRITPGISSFQAAAAALRSQFTIPDKVQTIILTRGEGRTLMPEKEKLSLLAKSQSTMCIFLSASIVDEVQKELLAEYPPETPVAACYKLTWKEEKIYRGELKNLAEIVKGNNLKLTTMIVVGDAIDNRKGLSRLYADEFKHIFRE